MPTNPDSIDLGHEDEIMEAFVAYDRLVRWEEHNSRLDATEPIVERAYARGRIIAMVANLAAEALGATSDGNETTTPNTEPNPDSIVEALRTVLGNSHVEGIHNSDGEWIQAGIVIEVDDARRMREEVIPAVESLVAENARLRAALEKHEGPTVTDTCSVCGEAVERLRTGPPDYWWRHVAPEHRFLHDVVRAPSRETTE